MAAEKSAFQVMSYNIKFATEEDGENSWSRRKSHLKDLIASYTPDVLGVQEARLEQLQFLKNKLKIYEYFGTGRDGGKKGLYNAIFYKAAIFSISEESTFWLSETPGEPSMGWDAAYPRVCTYALFTNKQTGKKCWIFNTHFDHQGEEAVEKSAALILQRIKAVNDEYYPVILMGDFNLEPEDRPIQFLAKNLNDSRKIAAKVAAGPEETFNAYEFQEPPIGRFDYIFVNDSVEVLRYAVLTDSREEKYPSDHFPVLVEIRL
ncbi:endonuclease/exonuclease/phosphatase family protein [Salinimicrobium sp. GXAS 041]|uniref:endonuclease/exonuclease/phosphatase family protein n=1 Tax=Salinimicrobium sp. GXAS 041 TaxID=3400806 RepID=UPI003C706EC8